MASEEAPKGEGPERSGAPSQPGQPDVPVAQAPVGEATVGYHQTVDTGYAEYADDGSGDRYAHAQDDGQTAVSSPEAMSSLPVPVSSGAPPPPFGSDAKPEEEDDDDEGMLRMSFLGHLEELRSRLLKIVGGLFAAFLGCLVFAPQLWNFVRAPAASALTQLGYSENLAQLTPMDGFNTIYIKLPLLAAVFVASPWILFQVWSFIAPGLYRKERRWAVPFVIISAGLFIAGGCFAYFVAFRFGLGFLLGIGKDKGVTPVVSLVEYFDLFVNVTLGIGILFELPILIFFLTLLRITTPGFLVRNARYAVLCIVIVAAIVTPTPDIVNLMLFAVPMIVLFFVGVFAGWVLTLSREGRSLWRAWAVLIVMILMILGVAAGTMIWQHNYKIVPRWPFIIP